MINLADEPIELRQLLKNHIEKVKLIEKPDDDQRNNTTRFLAKTREILLHEKRLTDFPFLTRQMQDMCDYHENKCRLAA